MLWLRLPGFFSGDYDGEPLSDDADNARISVFIIVAVFALQLTFGGLALLAMGH